jgi:DNA repair exonuclease SbcCD ATPase subunit
VDDKANEMDMEVGEGGSSSGVIVEEPYSFPSNGDMIVRSISANGVEVRGFAVNQKEEMAQYIQSLTQPPAASSSGAAGGSALNADDIVYNALATVQYSVAECKKLKAQNAKLERVVKVSVDLWCELGCFFNCTPLPQSNMKAHTEELKAEKKRKDTEWGEKLEGLKQTHKVEINKMRNEEMRLQARLKLSQDDSKARNGVDATEKKYQKDIQMLKNAKEDLERQLKQSRDLVADNCQKYKADKEELKQAKERLEELEPTKKELVELRQHIAQKTEVKYVEAKFEAEKRKMERDFDKKTRKLQKVIDDTTERNEELKERIRELKEATEEGEQMDD